MHSKRFSPIAWSLAWIHILPLAILFLCALLSNVIPGLSQSYRLTLGQVVLLAAILVLITMISDRWIRRRYSGRTLLIINLSTEVDGILKNLAGRLGGDEADVLRKSLGLMELSMRAHERGLAVGATTQPEALETEFTGFEKDLDG
jgi:hypothetical protein